MTSGKRTSEFFDSYAHDFSAIYGTSNSLTDRLINKFFRKSMLIRYMKTIERCNPIEGRTVLDIGCGPGHYGIALARKGAGHILGIDFAPAMIEIAVENAIGAGVADRCSFISGDFMSYESPDVFDYVILMGFMDYMEGPREVIEKVVAMTGSSAFFSFPAAGGLLAWQRRLRYKRRCDLYLYGRAELEDLFDGLPGAVTTIERIERDFFVAVAKG